jgi:hypothetical protein
MVRLFSTTSGFYGIDLDLVGSIRKNVEATGIWMEFPAQACHILESRRQGLVGQYKEYQDPTPLPPIIDQATQLYTQNFPFINLPNIQKIKQ